MAADLRRHPVAVGLAGVAVAAAVMHILPGVADALAWRRAAVLEGAWWLLLSAHLTHFDVVHLGANLLGLGLLAWLFRGRRGWPWLAAGLGAALVTGLGLLLEPAPLDEYRGLSAVLYGWLLWGLLGPGKPLLAGRWLLAAVLVAWVLIGIAVGGGQTLGLPLSVPAHAPAHLYGMLGALAGGWIALRLQRPTTPRRIGMLR
ncbi:MAG: hypothetical protein RIB46_20000 [Pseudomonadales bacterium]